MEDRGRKWFGTLNNPEEPDNAQAWLKALHEKNNADYVCGQLEKGENGTIHI